MLVKLEHLPKQSGVENRNIFETITWYVHSLYHICNATIFIYIYTPCKDGCMFSCLPTSPSQVSSIQSPCYTKAELLQLRGHNQCQTSPPNAAISWRPLGIDPGQTPHFRRLKYKDGAS